MAKGGRFLQHEEPKKGKAWKRVLLGILAVVLLVGGMGAGFVYSKMNKIQRAKTGENQLTDEKLAGLLVEDPTQETEATTAPTETTVPKETTPDWGKMGKVINILLIGQDARPGEDSKNADTIILLTVNKETKKITMTSFLRDTYVTVNDVVDANGKSHSGSTKLNLTYALGYSWSDSAGAMSVLDQVIKNNFGPEVDRNIEVDMDAFDACINAIHGVTITLTEDEADYMNKYFVEYDDRIYQEGENKLDGWAAEVYVRTRHSNYGDNDFNRTDRQRAVVGQVLEKVKNMSLLEINSLVDELLPYVLTDMSNTDITNYITELLPLLPQMTLESIQCPNEEMDRWGELKDIFHDGMEHSILHFDSTKAKNILVPITECD